MDDEEAFGPVLRRLRIARGLSQRALAQATHFDVMVVNRCEQGKRIPSAQFAAACDQFFGTTPLLSTLAEGANDMQRRNVLALTGVLAGGVALVGPAALTSVLRHALAVHSGTENWDEVVADVANLAANLAPSLGPTLESHLLVLAHHLSSGADREHLRAAAALSQAYGHWLANRGSLVHARGYYRAARQLADRSGDAALRADVRARTVSMGPYEGLTARQTLNGAEEALAIHPAPSLATVEAHAARVHVHALVGNLGQGRTAIKAMRADADKLSDDAGERAQRRVAYFATFLESRIGTSTSAGKTFGQAQLLLRPVRPWLADARVYLGRSMVRSGDVTGGVEYALSAVSELGRTDVRVVGFAVRDLVQSVPAGYKSTELDQLRGYADRDPGPWETIA